MYLAANTEYGGKATTLLDCEDMAVDLCELC